MAILHLDYTSVAIGHSVPVRVYLPHDHIDYSIPGYVDAKPLKTLYLLNGFHGNENDWLYLGEIIELFRKHNVAVIMPAGMNSFYIDEPDRGAKFGEFVSKELVTLTRKMFNLSDRREDTWIAGLSMGGYGALRNGLVNNDVFSVIGAFSPAILTKEYYETTGGKVNGFDFTRTFNQDNVDLFEISTNLKGPKPDLYLACGTEDFLIEPNKAFNAHLNSLNYGHTYVQDSGEHNWDYWRKHIVKFMDFATEHSK